MLLLRALMFGSVFALAAAQECNSGVLGAPFASDSSASGGCQDFPTMIILFEGTCEQYAFLCPPRELGGNDYVRAFCPVTCGLCDTFCEPKNDAISAWNYGIAVSETTPESIGVDTCIPYAEAITTCMPGFGNAPLGEYTGYHAFCPTESGMFPACLPTPEDSSTARKDPHLHFAHGGRADLRGEDGAIYNFLSAHNVSMNVKTVKTDFHWKEQLVHGTRIGAVYWTLKTPDGSLITVKYESSQESAPKAAFVATNGKPAITVSVDEAVTHQNVRIALTSAGLNVNNGHWAMTAAPAHFPYAKQNKNKYLLDIQVTPLYDADSDPSAPHGIFGQAFDGDDVGVDGARDGEADGLRDAAGRVVERTTAAQAEGAIEGSVGDYKMKGEFATEFKYSRFNGVHAPHRDVSKLTGVKHAKAKTAKKATASTADGDDLLKQLEELKALGAKLKKSA